MATTTRPANASLMPSASVAGSSADTNQSLTSAAATPAAASTATVADSGHRGGSRAGFLPAGEEAWQRQHEEHEQDAGANQAHRLRVSGGGRVELHARARAPP